MKNGLVLTAIAGVFAIATLSLGQKDDPQLVPYPEGYRDWTHVKSMALLPGHELYNVFGGLHHIYANDKALAAMKGGKHQYPDGSVLVFDLLAETGDSTALTEGERKVLGVMYRDSQKFAKTGGWGFEGFAGNTRNRAVTDGGESCFLCHDANAKATGLVFSKWRE